MNKIGNRVLGEIVAVMPAPPGMQADYFNDGQWWHEPVASFVQYVDCVEDSEIDLAIGALVRSVDGGRGNAVVAGWHNDHTSTGDPTWDEFIGLRLPGEPMDKREANRRARR